MNSFQRAIAGITGLDNVLEQNAELQESVELVAGQNALLQRQIEDLDYLNLADIHAVAEVLPGDAQFHLRTLNRLRRLRVENPLAKQAVKLIVRFTLGKGVDYTIAPDPEKVKEQAANDPTALEPTVPGGSKGGLIHAAKPSQVVGPTSPMKTNLTTFNKLASVEDITPPPVDPMGKNGSGGKPPPFAPKNPYLTPPTSSLKNPKLGGDDEKDDPISAIISSFWEDDENQIALTSHEAMVDFLDGIVTDGEKFMVCFQADTEPYVKMTEIPLEEIEQIIYDPENRKVPVYYKRRFRVLKFDGNDDMYKIAEDVTVKYYLDYRITDEQLARVKPNINIPATKLADENTRIFHRMVNPLWGRRGKRGISELYASREWFRVFKEFVEDRAAINAAATSVAFKRKIKGGPTEVARFRGTIGGLSTGYDSPENQGSEVKKLTRPSAAALYDSNPAVDLEWMKTDTGAVNAKEDGRMLLMAAGAGVSTNIHYFGEGGDANLATAQAMELPMVKSYEDWQQWVDDMLTDLVLYVLKIALNDPAIAKEALERFSVTFPPIITQDVVKHMTAWGQLVQTVAPGNKVVHKEAIKGALGVLRVPNIDALMEEIEAEEIQLELQRQQQHQDMINAVASQPAMPGANPIQDGTGNGAMPPDLKTVAKGRPAPARNGPKPA